MTLRVVDLEEARTGAQYGPESWLPVQLTGAIASDAGDALRRELERYLRAEVTGRALLIAGHRGAGKTTVALRAVADVADGILGAAAMTGRSAPQRPLLVKLHGPSLFSGQLPKGEGAAASTVDPLQGALVQITNGLYRALAAEASRCVRVQAAVPGVGRAERLELAAQVMLELDKGPGPRLLRAAWARMRRLSRGVLWPDADTGAPPDQGMREIAALATAAQAFRVCIGATTFTEKSLDTSTRKEEVELKRADAVQGAVDKLVAAAGGAGAGAAVASGASAGVMVAAGLIGALVGGVTLTGTWTRTRKRDETADYSFIRDFSLTTLDRDLPDVIDRVRAAGLAPVFVVDELDKLEDEGRDVERLIGRLKNLTTDYGFFCFLTNRAYFESVLQRNRRGAYPREHTYFSDMLFVHYDGASVLRYLVQTVRPDRDSAQDEAAGVLLAYAVRRRARGNTIGLRRELGRLFDAGGACRLPSATIAGRVQCWLETIVQVAIDIALEDQAVAERMEGNAFFGQVVADAMYRLSAAWDAEAGEVALGPEAMAAYLQSRSDAGGGAGAGDGPSAQEVALLSRAAVGMAELLCDVAALSARSVAHWEALGRTTLDGRAMARVRDAGAGVMARLRDVPLPQGVRGIVSRDKGREGVFLFEVDRFGAGLRVAAAVNPWRRVREWMAFADALLGALHTLDMTLDRVLPMMGLHGGVPEAELRGVLDAIREVDGQGGEIQAVARELPQLQAFVVGFGTPLAEVSWVLLLVRLVAEHAGVSGGGALRAIGRHLALVELGRSSMPEQALGALLDGIVTGVPAVDVPAGFGIDGDSVREWCAEVVRRGRTGVTVPASQRSGTGLPGRSWDDWRERVAAHVVDPSAPAGPIGFSELVEAALGWPPGGVFRRRIGAMTAAEWSELAILGFDPGTNPVPGRLDAPRWVVLPALGALKFSRRVLEAAAALPGMGDTLLAARIVAAGPELEEDQSILWTSDGDTDALPALTAQSGVLVVAPERLLAAQPLVRWLRNLGALSRLGHESST